MAKITSEKQITAQTNIKSEKFKNFFINNSLVLRNVCLSIFAFLTVFIFVMLMVPSTPAHSQVQYINQTAFYSVKYNDTFTNNYISLTATGIILLILIAISVAFLVTYICINKDKIKDSYIQLDEKSKKKKIILDSIIYSSLALAFLLMFIFVLIPPNFSKTMQYFWIGTLEDETNFMSRESIIASLQKLNVTEINGEPTWDQISTGILSATLQAKIASFDVSFAFTPFTVFNAGVVAFTDAIYAVVVLFVLLFGLFVFSCLFKYISYKGIKINFSFKKETFLQIQQKIKDKQDYKKQINKTRKELLEKENELLKTLHDVNLDKVDQEKKLGLISQEELETMISRNNEIKKQLEELVKQKAEINKQRVANSKIRTALSKAQSQNNKSTVRKDKKQTITIPDKELDEIFRNLEID